MNVTASEKKRLP